MALMSFVGVLLLLFCFFSTRERVEHVVDKKPLSEQFKLLLKNDQWLVLAACCVFGTLGYAMRGGVALYYAIYFLGASEIVAGQFVRSEEHTSELQSRGHLVCRLLLEKKKSHM